MNTSYFTVKENLAFLKYSKLCKLQQKNRTDLRTNHLSDCACAHLKIANIQSELKADIENACFMSILSYGSTDKGIIEEEIVYMCFLLDNKPISKFADIKNLNKADAEGILNAIIEVLKSLNFLKVWVMRNIF